MASSKKIARGIIGIDIGGTKLDAIVWRGKKIVSSKIMPTPKSRAALLSVIAEIVSLQKNAAIGVAVAGAVNHRTGNVLRSAHLPFLSGWGLKQTLARRHRVRVEVENDVNCFLLGEKKFRDARGKKNVVGLMLGTGVGGAAIVNGKLMHGWQGTAGHLGHMIIERGLEVEDLISSQGFRKLGYSDPRKAPVWVYRQVEKYLATALLNIINIFDPELILVGGGIAGADKFSLATAVRFIKRKSVAGGHNLPQIKLSRLKHAPALGAVSLFLK